MILVIGLTGKNISLRNAFHLPYADAGRAATCGLAWFGEPGGEAEDLERRIGLIALDPAG